MAKFLSNISLETAHDIQFKNTAGTNTGKIEADGNNLVLSNAVGDILLGDGASDVYIGDGTNNVDILFEQSGNIMADASASGVTITLGSSNTTLAFGGATSFADIVSAFSSTGTNTVDIGTNAKPFKDIYAAHHVGGSSINYATSRGWVEDSAPLSETQVGYFGGNFSRNGDAAENEVVWGIDPFDNKALLWKAIGNTSDDDDDGGWNKDITIPANNNIGYLSYVYFKADFTPDSSEDGQVYLGCGTTSGQTINISDDSNNTNPYFVSRRLDQANNDGAVVANRWYLMVGVIQAYNNETTDTNTLSGIYDVETGEKVYNGAEFKMGNNTTGQRHRTYLYYQDSGSAGNVYFWNPGFHAIDGSEPKIQDLVKRQTLGSTLKVGRDKDNYIDFTTDNQMTLRIGGVDQLVLNQSRLAPSSNDASILGSASLSWSDLFLASGAVINFNNGDVTLTHSGNNLAIAGGNLEFTGYGIVMDGNTITGIDDSDEFTDDDYHIMTSAAINDKFLALSGGTMTGDIAMGNNDITGVKYIQYNGDVDIRTSTGEYSIYGAANGQTALYTNGVKTFETTTTGVDITGGTVGMPSGGILNFNSGDITVTHSSNKLTFDGASAIQINTPAANSTSQNLILNRPAAGSHYSSIEWHTDGTVDWSIGQNSADNFEIFENGADATTRFTIEEGGNIGIGVTDPTQKLHVDGHALISGEKYYYVNGTGAGMGSDASGNLILRQNSANLMTTSGSNATFAGDITADNITSTSNSGDASIYINSTRPTLGFTDTNSFTDANDIYLIRAGSNILQFQYYDDSASSTTETFNITAAGNATFAGDVTAGGKVTTTEIEGSSILLDSAGDITLDAAGNDVLFKDAGTHIGTINMSSSNLTILSSVNDKDIIFKGKDNSSDITALTLDMSDAGAASFNHTITWGSGKGILHYGSDRAILRADQVLEIQTNGTSSPTAAITLDTSQNATFANHVIIDNNKELRFKDSGATERTILELTSADDLYLGGSFSGSMIFVGGGSYTERMRIDDSGGVLLSSTLTVGADDTGHDVIFYGATSGRYIMWDESDDALEGTDNVRIKLGASSDLQIVHTGSDSYIHNTSNTNLYFKQSGVDTDIIFQADDGAGSETEYFRMDGGAGANVSSKSIYIADNKRLYAGGGGDMGIYHDGTNNYIDNTNGDLYIRNTHDAKDIIFQSDDGSGGVTPYITLDGSDTAIKIGKELQINGDSRKLKLGASGDLEMFHNGTDSSINNATGHLYIKNEANAKDIIFQSDDGSSGVTAYLTLDGSAVKTLIHKSVEFSGGGFDFGSDGSGADASFYGDTSGRLMKWDASDNSLIFNDNTTAKFGNGGDMQLSHDGSNSKITNMVGHLSIINYSDGSDIIFETDNGSGGNTEYLKLDGGITSILAYKDILMANDGNNGKIKFGASQDLQIYHDGSNSFISDTGTGDLYVEASSNFFLRDESNGQVWISAAATGVTLRYQDNVKLSTNSSGVKTAYGKTSATDGDAAGDIVYFGGTTSMEVGEIYYLTSSGTWALTDADAEATAKGMLAVALGSASDTDGMLIRGMVTLDHDPGTVGNTLFLSTTPGTATWNPPSGNGDIVRVIGYCLDSTNGQIYFNPDGTFVEVTA